MCWRFLIYIFDTRLILKYKSRPRDLTLKNKSRPCDLTLKYKGRSRDIILKYKSRPRDLILSHFCVVQSTRPLTDTYATVQVISSWCGTRFVTPPPYLQHSCITNLHTCQLYQAGLKPNCLNQGHVYTVGKVNAHLPTNLLHASKKSCSVSKYTLDKLNKRNHNLHYGNIKKVSECKNENNNRYKAGWWWHSKRTKFWIFLSLFSMETVNIS